MGFHTFPIDRADALEDPSRYRYCSREELVDALGLGGDGVVADLGSGTGFYTRDVAPFAGEVRAVDVQAEMHEVHREHGVAENVTLVTAAIDDLPFEDGSLDAAFSTMTYHEFAGDGALDELRRVLGPGGRLVTVDWSGAGDGESGPPVDERYTVEDAVAHHRDAGFEVVARAARPETFVLVGDVADR